MEYALFFDETRMTDIAIIGGNNASLAEMAGQLSSKGVRVLHSMIRLP
jgi:phosphoenolpyruvate synthase/pyruvate phosphate dikinase